MTRPLLQGHLVRLTALEPEMDAEAGARWTHDDLFDRLSDSGPAYPWHAKRVREDIEKQEKNPRGYLFAIRTLTEGRSIGIIELDGIQWQHGDCYVGIGIGERELWGKGYGTDAMNEALRYAFEELNLYRVSLNVFEYNQRAVLSYEKAGFKVEGRAREWLLRDGQKYDVIFMSILHKEWESRQGAEA